MTFSLKSGVTERRRGVFFGLRLNVYSTTTRRFSIRHVVDATRVVVKSCEHRLDEARPFPFERALQRAGEPLGALGARGGDAEARGDVCPVDFRIGERRQTSRRARFARDVVCILFRVSVRALHHLFQLEYGVARVRAHDRDDVQPLPRLRPQRLRGIEPTAIGLKINYLSIRTCDCGTDCGRRTESYRSSGQAQVSKSRTSGRSIPICSATRE